MSKVYVRFECGRESRLGPTYGPYEWVQLTYKTLRVSPDGDEIAGYVESEGDWYLTDLEHESANLGWSDVIVYGQEEEKP